MPHCEVVSPPPLIRHPGFDRFDAGFLGVLTATFAIALSIGGQKISAPAILFLAVVNMASLALGRAAFGAHVSAFRGFAEYVLGISIFSLIVLAVCEFATTGAAAGATVAVIAGIGAAIFRVRRGRMTPAGDLPSTSLAALICVAAFIWSWQAILAVPNLRDQGIFTAWTDYFIHAGELAQFANFGALHGTSIFAAGAPLPLYHYGSYMIPAALCGLTHISALVSATVLWTLLGYVLLGLAVAFLGETLGGKTGGVLAVVAVLLIPDAAHYGLKNPFFDFHWLMQVSASSCYGTALACLAMASMLRWLRAGAPADLGWAAGLTLAVFEFRVHIFVVLALTDIFLFAGAWRPRKPWYRPALLFAGLAIAATASLLVRQFPRAPQFWSGPHHPIADLVQLLGMPPSPYAALFKSIVGTAPPSFCPHEFWVFCILLAGLGILLIAAFGALVLIYAAGLVLALRRGAAIEDFVPLAAIAAYFLIVVSFPETPQEPYEFAHRPFVFPYTMLAIWCARDAAAWLAPVFRRRSIPLAAGYALLIVPMMLQRNAQSSMLQWSNLYSHLPVPPPLQEAAAFLRAHAAAGAVVADPAGPLDEAFLALSERPAESPGTIFLQLQSGITAANALSRQAALAETLAGRPAPGIAWIVTYPGQSPAAPPAWQGGGYAVSAAP